MRIALQIDYDRGIAVYRQIVDAVRAALASGELPRGEQLPTIHELARQLDVNPNTVARAYRDLEQEGYLVSRRGRGTFAAQARPLSRRERRAELRAIFDRAVAEAARYGIGRAELIRFFREAKP